MEEKAFYCLYHPAAVLRVTGEDALAFLQGQFTQELRFPVGKLSTYGLWLNQKGKVVADSFALRDGESWMLVSTSSTADTIRERLEAYIIADDVTVEDVSAQWTGLALCGSNVPDRLSRQGVSMPPPGEWADVDGGILFPGRRMKDASWEWLIRAGASIPRAISAAGLSEGSSLQLELVRVAAGIPKIPDELGANDLPNEAGLEQDAVSYSKGCYLGQEVMARLKSMGQVRRKLLRVRGAIPPPSCPVSLYAGSKKIGELRSAFPAGTGQEFVGLAMVSLLGLNRESAVSLAPEGPLGVVFVGGAE